MGARDKDPIQVANAMFHAWDVMDWRAVADLFTPDGQFHVMMLDPLVGRDAIYARLSEWGANCTAMDIRVRSIGAVDSRVFAERVDIFTWGGRECALPCVGVLEIDDGRVAHWREYFDDKTMQTALQG